MQITLLRDHGDLNHVNHHSTAKLPSDKSIQPNQRSKIFELSSILDVAKVIRSHSNTYFCSIRVFHVILLKIILFRFKVCLVYETLESINPKIYLLEIQTNKWQFLSDTFTEYLRMCIAHLGLPYWELCFAQTCRLPSWAEQLYLLLAPHLLEHNSNDTQRNRFRGNQQELKVYNQLDVSIFKTKPKCKKAIA